MLGNYYSGFVKSFVFVTREMVSQVAVRLGILSAMNHQAQNQQGSHLANPISLGLLVKWSQEEHV